MLCCASWEGNAGLEWPTRQSFPTLEGWNLTLGLWRHRPLDPAWPGSLNYLCCPPHCVGGGFSISCPANAFQSVGPFSYLWFETHPHPHSGLTWSKLYPLFRSQQWNHPWLSIEKLQWKWYKDHLWIEHSVVKDLDSVLIVMKGTSHYSLYVNYKVHSLVLLDMFILLSKIMFLREGFCVSG